MRIAFTLAALFAIPGAAHAADCYAVPPAVAAKAAAKLKKGLRIAPYCKANGSA